MKQSMRNDGMSQEMNQDIDQQKQDQQIQTQSLDDNNRPAEVDELDFEEEERPSRAGDTPEPADVQYYRAAERAREAGLTGAAAPDDDSTRDDLTPENLIAEDGARSPKEPGGDQPVEWDLTEKYDIGGGHGFDEAELARRDPLDKKPWDGDADEPLESLPEADEDYFMDDDDDESRAAD